MFDVVCVGILVADVIAKTVDKVPESGKLGLLIVSDYITVAVQ